MQIGELSRQTGVSVRMLRYYERQELLTPARTASGYRTYGNGDVERVQRIVLLNKAGLTLERVRPIVACEVRGSAGFRPCDALKTSLRHAVAELNEQIDKLLGVRTLLAELIGDAE